MQERCVTIDRVTYPLPGNFTVFATQNPVEYEGTYPLPEAQKDRFMLRITMDYPTREEELTLAQRMLGQDSPEAVLALGRVNPVIGVQELDTLRQCLQKITIRSELMDYLVDIIRTTRTHGSVHVGAGPRATQALLLSGRAHAAMAGRDFVVPDDIKTMAGSVLEHRIILRPEFEIEGYTVPEVIQQILREVAIPR
jgi:MoxR-like ATPase